MPTQNQMLIFKHIPINMFVQDINTAKIHAILLKALDPKSPLKSIFTNFFGISISIWLQFDGFDQLYAISSFLNIIKRFIFLIHS